MEGSGSGSGSATLIFKIPKYNEHSSRKEPKILQPFAFLFCVNMKMWRTWGGGLFTASLDGIDKRRPLCFYFRLALGTGLYTVTNVSEWSPSPAGNHVMSPIKLFLAVNNSGIPASPGRPPPPPKARAMSIFGQEEPYQWHLRIHSWWRGSLINIFNSVYRCSAINRYFTTVQFRSILGYLFWAMGSRIRYLYSITL